MKARQAPHTRPASVRAQRLSLFSIGLALVIASGVWLFRGLPDLSAPSGGRDISFAAHGNTLVGSLHLPADATDAPVAVLVHGDGPQDRYAGSGYAPIIHVLNDAGIGTFSWDSAGVGASTGNWLDYGMSMRAAEAVAAARAVQAHTAGDVGFIGFSQAGWVIPQALHDMGDDTFAVLVGPATNWRDQGDYFARVRLANQGATDAAIADDVARQRAIDADVFGPPARYDEYLRHAGDDPMSRDRFDFVARNYEVDSRADISLLTSPLLAMWGADDRNVEAQVEEQRFNEHLPASRHARTEIVVWPDATHGLLNSAVYDYQLTSQWPWYLQVRAASEGRRMFAPGAVEYIADWVLGTVGQPGRPDSG